MVRKFLVEFIGEKKVLLSFSGATVRIICASTWFIGDRTSALKNISVNPILGSLLWYYLHFYINLAAFFEYILCCLIAMLMPPDVLTCPKNTATVWDAWKDDVLKSHIFNKLWNGSQPHGKVMEPWLPIVTETIINYSRFKTVYHVLKFLIHHFRILSY